MRGCLKQLLAEPSLPVAVLGKVNAEQAQAPAQPCAEQDQRSTGRGDQTFSKPALSCQDKKAASDTRGEFSWVYMFHRSPEQRNITCTMCLCVCRIPQPQPCSWCKNTKAFAQLILCHPCYPYSPSAAGAPTRFARWSW